MSSTHRPAKEEQGRKFRALLASDDDVALFGEGACLVFAVALHETFGYRLVWIPGHPDFAVQGVRPVSHVFCLLSDSDDYAVDVRGTRRISDVLDAFGGTDAILTSLPELLEWRCDPRRGIYAEPWFHDAALIRARKRIEWHRGFFDGTKKELIPPAT